MIAEVWEQYPPKTIEQTLEDRLERASYRFAKTMARNPHFYTTRKTWESGKEFEQCVQYIRDVGFVERYGRTDYVVFILNDFKYWTMGNSLDKTKLINRKTL